MSKHYDNRLMDESVIVRMRERGLSVREIVSRLGVSEYFVRKALKGVCGGS